MMPRIFSQAALFGAGLLLSMALSPGPALGDVSEPVHHDVEIVINAQNATVSITDEISLSASDAVLFQLSPLFIVDEVLVDGAPHKPSRSERGIAIALGEHALHRLTIRAHTRLQPATPPFNMAFLGADGGFLGVNWLAHPLGVAATWRATVASNQGQRAVMSGTLVAEEVTPDGTRATFASERPGQLPVLITGPFSVNETTSDGVRVRTYFHPELASHGEAYLEAASNHIQRYSKIIGAYPYENFSIVSGPVPIGVAFPAMTYMGRRVLAMPFIRAASLPHEILHSWWGNAVEIDYQGGNWAEGLTNYMTTHDLDPVGESAQQTEQRLQAEKETRQEWLRNYAALPVRSDMALTEFTSKTHDRTQVIGYAKAAFVFHMLRKEVGDDVFQRAIRRLYKDNAFKRTGWKEVEAAFRRTAGHDLGAFFHQWVVRKGAPRLKAIISQPSDGQLQLRLRQSQKGRGYHLRLTLEIETDQGATREARMMQGSGQTLNLKASGKVRAVTIDPDYDMFRRLGKGEAPAILRDITLASRVTAIALNNDAASGIEVVAQWGLALDRVSESLMGAPVQRVSPSALEELPQGSLIIAGGGDQISAFASRHNLPASPSELASQGTAQGGALVWSDRDAQGRAILFIKAQNPEALAATSRALVHYKRRSWISFEHGTATNKGTWAMGPGTLHKRFD